LGALPHSEQMSFFSAMRFGFCPITTSKSTPFAFSASLR
jgi:hypothetical protein